jgi:hypothetical protein
VVVEGAYCTRRRVQAQRLLEKEQTQRQVGDDPERLRQERRLEHRKTGMDREERESEWPWEVADQVNLCKRSVGEV